MTKVRDIPKDFNLYEMYIVIINNKGKVFLIFAIITAIGIWKASNLSINGSVLIAPAETTIFSKYSYVNISMKNKGFEERFDRDKIFVMVKERFENSKTLIEVLKNKNLVKEATVGMSNLEKQRAYFDYAKLFKLERIGMITETSDDTYWTVSFTWSDREEGFAIIEETLHKILKKIQQDLVAELLVVAKSLETKDKQLLKELEVTQANITETAIFLITAKKIHLTEQAAIARELGIDKPAKMEMQLLKERSDTSYESLRKDQIEDFRRGMITKSMEERSTSPIDYLQGYISLEKEIELINNRTLEVNLILLPEYITTKIDIFKIQNDITSQELMSFVNFVKKDDSQAWITMGLIDITSSKKSIIITLSIFFGGLIGICYVLINNFMIREKQKYLDS